MSWIRHKASPNLENKLQSALVIRTTFVPLCFFEKNVLIASRTYECSYSQRNYLVFWKSVLMAHVLIARVSYDVLIANVLIARVDCTVNPWWTPISMDYYKLWHFSGLIHHVLQELVNTKCYGLSQV